MKIADEKALKILDILEEQFCVSLRELGVTEGVIICLKDQALKEILKLKVHIPKQRSFDDEVSDEWGDYERERHEQFLLGYNQALEDVSKLN